MWGATREPLGFLLDNGISIHAPVWGATIDPEESLRVIENFNPRARVGRDNTA